MCEIEELYGCSNCGLIKAKSDFTPRNGRIRPVHSWCKGCLNEEMSKRRQEFRADNPLLPKKTYSEKLEARRNIRRKQRADFRIFVDTLKSVPCSDCGKIFDPICMDFDHLDKYGRSCAEFSELRGASKERILAEAAKCDIICSNCHRIRTHLDILLVRDSLIRQHCS